MTWPARGAVIVQEANYPASTQVVVVGVGGGGGPPPPPVSLPSLCSRGVWSWSRQFTTRLTVQTPAADGGAFSLLVRCPFWATGANTVTLNGDPLPNPAPGTYLNLTRVWAAGDVLEVYWPAAVRFEQLTDDRQEWQGVGALM